MINSSILKLRTSIHQTSEKAGHRVEEHIYNTYNQWKACIQSVWRILRNGQDMDKKEMKINTELIYIEKEILKIYNGNDQQCYFLKYYWSQQSLARLIKKTCK